MCYEEKTFEICHRLTPIGKERYREMLEREADKILWQHDHPIKAFINRLLGREDG